MLTRRSFLQGTIGLAGAAAAAWGAQRTGAAGPARTFTFGYDQPHETAYGFMADRFDEKLRELSGGTLAIRQFPTAALGQEPEMAQKVRTGDIDFAINSTANTATVVPQAGVFSLHFIFRDEQHLLQVVTNRAVNAYFKKMILDNTTGARSLGLMTLGLRNMYSKFPVSSVRDVAGKKVRVQATKTEDAFFSAYRAVPVHMPFGQVYTSLQTGLVQIAENSNDIYLKNKHYEAAPVLSKTQHEANNNQLWVSQKTLDGLTDQQRKWVEDAAAYALPRAAARAIEYDAVAAKTLQGLGVRYHAQVDKESFIALAAPLQDPQAQDLGPYAVQLLKFVRNVK
ncbi:MAG TPA: TRAP transporter substrate-binding protein [bacterium]|nr:TRAP transporter substrate-binding protein [bacterium]